MNRISILLLLTLPGATILDVRAGDAERPVPPVPEVPEFTRNDPAVHGREVALHADRFDEGWVDEYSQIRMTLRDAGGDQVERDSVRILLEGKDGDKSIARFLAPAEIKGVAALTHEHPESVDDNWLYLPASQRVRRISGANKTASFQGTEFTYEDLSNLIVAKYDWKYVKEEELEKDGERLPVHRIEAQPKFRDTGYSKLIVFIHRETWRRERVEYHDKAGRPLKVLDYGKWKLFHGRFWRPMRLDMMNLQTKRSTTIDVTSTLLDLSRYRSERTGEPRANLPDRLFTTQALTGK